MSLKQKIINTISALAGAIIALFLNFFITSYILIPDPCYYHTHDTTLLFDIFFDLTSSDGYHPFPSLFNFILTIIVGALLGLKISISILKRLNQKRL